MSNTDAHGFRMNEGKILRNLSQSIGNDNFNNCAGHVTVCMSSEFDDNVEAILFDCAHN